MKLLHSKRGYTLVELLAVIAILTIISTITFAMFGELDKLSDNRVDQSRIVIYNRAFEDFRFTDYSTLQSTPKEEVAVVKGGKVKINQYFNLSSADIKALSNSGRGQYPQTFLECVATIRAYCGTNDILPSPAAGLSYSYFYHIPEGKCYVKPVSEISKTDTEWINLNDYYYLITNYKLGDVNGDKYISILDVDELRKHLSGHNNIKDPYLIACCDVNLDGVVNVSDVTLLRQYVSKLEDIPSWS